MHLFNADENQEVWFNFNTAVAAQLRPFFSITSSSDPKGGLVSVDLEPGVQLDRDYGNQNFTIAFTVANNLLGWYLYSIISNI